MPSLDVHLRSVFLIIRPTHGHGFEDGQPETESVDAAKDAHMLRKHVPKNPFRNPDNTGRTFSLDLEPDRAHEGLVLGLERVVRFGQTLGHSSDRI